MPKSFLQIQTNCHGKGYLWKKGIIIKLKELSENFFEFKKSVQRNHLIEANILFGKVLEKIYHLAFFISHQYYPWQTHLHWAFENLPVSKIELGTKINSLLSINNWGEKVDKINSIIEYYRNYIEQRKKIALDNGYSSDQFWVWSLWG